MICERQLLFVEIEALSIKPVKNSNIYIETIADIKLFGGTKVDEIVKNMQEVLEPREGNCKLIILYFIFVSICVYFKVLKRICNTTSYIV